MDRSCRTNVKTRNAYRILVGKPEEKRQLRRPRRRWMDSMKMDLRQWGGGCGLDRSGLGWGPVEVFREHCNETSGSIKCWDFLSS
jgi:hypothetical protein